MCRFKWSKHLFASGALCTSFALGFSMPDAFAADPNAVEVALQPPFDAARFEKEPEEKQWSLIVGGGGIYEPTYEGGDEFEVSRFHSSSSPGETGWKSIRAGLP